MATAKRKKAATKKAVPHIQRKRKFITIENKGREKITTTREIIGATEAQLKAAYKNRLHDNLANLLLQKEMATTKRIKAKLQKKISEVKRKIKNL